ncbi:hypothetical protein CRENPOLYSF1_350016 [Crenothrix polyspora]|uniref:Uncharacterized protein n=1 Tax=Crenothrix polyspora TaxID=360316 RepID=A0A1R4H9P6_9GAMM|nr:hypothetical protein CRENPOLYSF1_350016 [Crenothrix polyspora]
MAGEQKNTVINKPSNKYQILGLVFGLNNIAIVASYFWLFLRIHLKYTKKAGLLYAVSQKGKKFT